VLDWRSSVPQARWKGARQPPCGPDRAASRGGTHRGSRQGQLPAAMTLLRFPQPAAADRGCWAAAALHASGTLLGPGHAPSAVPPPPCPRACSPTSSSTTRAPLRTWTSPSPTSRSLASRQARCPSSSTACSSSAQVGAAPLAASQQSRPGGPAPGLSRPGRAAPPAAAAAAQRKPPSCTLPPPPQASQWTPRRSGGPSARRRSRPPPTSPAL
jgi:hypothetical protein